MKRGRISVGLLISLMISFGAAGQEKIDSYDRTGSDSEGARIDNLATALTKDPHKLGLVIIYSGASAARLPDAVRDMQGVKSWLLFRDPSGKLVNRVTFRLVPSDQHGFKELWLYDAERMPAAAGGIEVKPTDRRTWEFIDLSTLSQPLLIASICSECDPAVPELADDAFGDEMFSNLLKHYPHYSGEIVAVPKGPISGLNYSRRIRSAMQLAKVRRRLLIRKYKLRNAIAIRAEKDNSVRDEPARLLYYIIPAKH